MAAPGERHAQIAALAAAVLGAAAMAASTADPPGDDQDPGPYRPAGEQRQDNADG